MTSPYAQIGPKLVEQGYAVIPIAPGTKKPGEMQNGKWVGMREWNARFTARLPTEIETDLWSSLPDAGAGLVTGYADVIGIDIDVDDPPIVNAIESVLPYTPVRKAGAKGSTLFFRGKGVESVSFNEYAPDGTRLRRLCDIIGPGRQTVLPPSRHPDTGKPYRWVGEEALDRVKPEDLPELPSDIALKIADALKPFGYRPDRSALPQSRPVAYSDASTPHRALNDAALGNLGRWVPALGLFKLKSRGPGYVAVASWRDSYRGRPLEQRSPNLKIHPTGIRDFHDNDRTYTAIDLIQAARVCGLDEAFRWLEAQLGLAEEGWSTELEALPPHDPETGEILEPAPALPAPSAEAPRPPLDTSDELPEHLTRVPGLLGQVIDWIDDTARQPNRVLALGAAVTLLGTLVGRRVAGPTLSGTHLYVVTLAPSGSGKDHALRQVEPLLKAANAGHLAGPDDFMSMTAIIAVLQRSPLCLCAMDEFGAYLGRVSHRRASPHEKGMTKILRSAWGASFKTLRTPEWGARPSEAIYAPAMSIYGNSTPGEFFASLQGEDVINGFLNRFLLLQTEKATSDRKPKLDPLKVPPGLAQALARFHHQAISLTPAEMAEPFDQGRPAQIDWADERSEAYLSMFRLQVESIRADEALDPFLARTVEMGVRLATIRAAGQGSSVSVADLTWGADIALWSARRMAAAAGEHMAENEFAGYANRIVRFIKKKGFGVSRREIQMHLKGALKVRELTDIMDMLVEAGRLQTVRTSATMPNRPNTAPLYAIGPK